MTPILKNILFKPFKSEDKTESGLFVPDSFKEVNNKGTIIAVGNRVKKLKVGQIGYRVKGHGTEIIIGGEKHFLMDENAILSVQ